MSSEIAEYEALIKDKFEDKMKTATILDKIISDTKLVCPTSKADGFYISANDWNLLVRNIKKHINTLIIGPTGSGKTSVVGEVCNRLGIPFHIFDMGCMIDPISSLLGVHRLEGGKSVFDYAKFTQVIQEPCVILLDELSRAPQSAMNILFPCLEDRRSLSIEMACGKGVREIKIHPEVTFIATANVGVEYSGTNSMDRALVNRFFTLELGYIPAKEESAVLSKRTGIEKTISDLIVKIASNIRNLATKQEVSTSPSIRETLMAAELVSDGWDLRQAMQMVYLPLYEGSKSEGERGTIFKTLSSY
jgi:MoxR-like ATPase